MFYFWVSLHFIALVNNDFNFVRGYLFFLLTIPVLKFLKIVEISKELIEKERPQIRERNNPTKRKDEDAPGPAFH